MENFIDWGKAKSHQEVTSLNVGDQIVTANGVGMEITKITITNVHLLGRTAPNVQVTYKYDDNGNMGEETVGMLNFYNNLNS